MMENQNPTNTPPPSFSSSAQQYKRSKIILVIWVLALASTFLTLGFLWLKERDNTSRLNNQVTSLNGQINSLNTKVKQLDSSDTASQATQKQQTTTVFKADVGKFTLTLPSEYAIVKEHDGGGEGGYTTELLMGKKSKDAGVVESESYGRVKITATTSVTAEPFDKWVQIRLKNSYADPQKQPALTIDGLQTQAYSAGGIVGSTVIFFQKGNIYYEILQYNTDAPETKTTLDLVLKGFKFN